MRFKLYPGAYAPTRAHFSDAGIDFKTPEGFMLEKWHGGIDGEDTQVVDLLVSVEIPIGYCGFFKSKSGLMINHGIVCDGGVIDSGFRGHLKVRMTNKSNHDYMFERGDKLVQMVILPCALLNTIEVDELEYAKDGRNHSGFGSTGR